MIMNDRLKNIENKIYGNGKRGMLERIGRIEIVIYIILSLQASILIKLFLGGIK